MNSLVRKCPFSRDLKYFNLILCKFAMQLENVVENSVHLKSEMSWFSECKYKKTDFSKFNCSIDNWWKNVCILPGHETFCFLLHIRPCGFTSGYFGVDDRYRSSLRILYISINCLHPRFFFPFILDPGLFFVPLRKQFSCNLYIFSNFPIENWIIHNDRKTAMQQNCTLITLTHSWYSRSVHPKPLKLHFRSLPELEISGNRFPRIQSRKARIPLLYSLPLAFCFHQKSWTQYFRQSLIHIYKIIWMKTMDVKIHITRKYS